MTLDTLCCTDITVSVIEFVTRPWIDGSRRQCTHAILNAAPLIVASIEQCHNGFESYTFCIIFEHKIWVLTAGTEEVQSSHSTLCAARGDTTHIKCNLYKFFENLALNSYGHLEYNLQHYSPLLLPLWWKFALHFLWYALCHVSMSLIILYINAKPMGFSGVQHTLNNV